jgi:DNA repair protein RecO (recombination protein O)
MSLVKCRAIVIRSVQYSETSVVLKCYTDQFGMQSFMVNGVRSKRGAIRPSHLMPLNLLELEITHQENKNLQRIRELRCEPPLRTLHYDMRKNAVGTFICELLYRVVREEHQQDEALFSFLFNSIQILDLEEDVVTLFPLYFPLQLTRYLGFFPKGEYTPVTNGFDLREGFFTEYDARDPQLADPVTSALISDLLKSSFSDLRTLTIPYMLRNSLLDQLLAYYSLHIESFREMRSHVVLREVLA